MEVLDSLAPHPVGPVVCIREPFQPSLSAHSRENRFRHLAGQAGYEGGFIQHYITPLVYPGVIPERWGLVSGLSVVIWNVLVYTLLVVTQRRSDPFRAARITYRGGWRIQEGKPRAATGGAQEDAERTVTKRVSER